MVEGISNRDNKPLPIGISIGILVCNEADAIRSALESLFGQSLFAQLSRRQLKCEIVCVANGCTDATAAIAEDFFQAEARAHPCKEFFVCRTVNLPERGKINAWNRFVHDLSAQEAQALFLMDGDIVLQGPDTLWNMFAALEANSSAGIATDQPLKDIAFKTRPSLQEKLSTATSRMTQGGAAQLTGQLYCIRAVIARNIYLPKDLAACEDGFIKALTCTSFLTGDLSPERIVLAPNASHIFQAYTRFADILKNQKRQIIGQTIVHLLVDKHLRNLPLEQKMKMGETVRTKEQADPDWLKRLIAAHLRQVRFFWRLFPDLLTFRFRRLAKLKGGKKLMHLPAAVAGFLVAMLAGWLAFRFLKQGSTHYWPDTTSPQLGTWAVRQAEGAGPWVKNQV